MRVEEMKGTESREMGITEKESKGKRKKRRQE